VLYNTGTTNVVVRWVKGRLMAGIDHKVYELTSAGPALPAGDLRFTHLNTAWTWVDFAEGTNAIYAAGNAGSQGSIYKFVLDSTGAVPTLAKGGVLTAQLPLGEVVNCLTTYLGSFVGIGTNKGFRVGQIDSNGDIVYGPLLIDGIGSVKGVAAYDRFFFVAATNSIDSSSWLYRVDLGQIITDAGATVAKMAYATDLQAHAAGVVSGVTNFGSSDRMVFSSGRHGRLPGVGLHAGGQRLLLHRQGALQHPGAQDLQVPVGEDADGSDGLADGEHRGARRGHDIHPDHLPGRLRRHHRRTPGRSRPGR
jgi:hypothetical protein